MSDEAYQATSDSHDGLTSVGAKTIEIYQKQMELTDRLWAYFGQNSMVLIMLSLVVIITGDVANLRWIPWWIWAIPAVAYFIFTLGNYKALSLSLDELRVLRGVAIAESRLDLKGLEPAASKRFHILMTFIILVAYGVITWTALSPR